GVGGERGDGDAAELGRGNLSERGSSFRERSPEPICKDHVPHRNHAQQRLSKLRYEVVTQEPVCHSASRRSTRVDVRTIPDLIQSAFETHRKPDAFLVKREGGWTPVSMAEVLARVRAVMGALRTRGVRHGDRVVLLAESSLEWALADMAIMSLGAITVPIYPTLPAYEIAPLLSDTGAIGAFVSTKEQREKLESARGKTSAVRWVWCYGEEPLPEGEGEVG